MTNFFFVAHTLNDLLIVEKFLLDYKFYTPRADKRNSYTLDWLDQYNYNLFASDIEKRNIRRMYPILIGSKHCTVLPPKLSNTFHQPAGENLSEYIEKYTSEGMCNVDLDVAIDPDKYPEFFI